MKNIKRITAMMLVICLLCSMTQVFATDSKVTIQITGTQNYSEAYAVLDQVNAYRTENDLPALKMDEDLLAAAMQRAAECSVYYNHIRPDGTECFTALPSKYDFETAGENIAIGYTSASEVTNGWINSESHRENILDSDFTNIGIGCFYQDGAISWVQLFTSGSGTAPSTQPENTTATATIDILTDNLDIQHKIVETNDPVGFKCILRNLNTGFPTNRSFIELDNFNITYASADKDILNIDSTTGIIKKSTNGTTTLYGYIEGILVLEASITPPVVERIVGDADGDGKVSNTDLIAIARYIVDLPVELDLIAADVDESGDISNVDLIWVARFIVGLE